jgi:cysteine desulfurase
MMPFLTSEFGNPSSSTHEWGLRARKAVEEARASVAQLIGSSPDEIVFTSGATEANNLAIKGCARLRARRGLGRHLVTTRLDHPSVTDVVEALRDDGFDSTFISPDSQGIVQPESVIQSLREDTVLVSALAANGELGILEPIKEIGEGCRSKGAIVHTDATQAVGKVPVDVEEMQVDLLSMSAHKLYGPKGVGALYVRTGVELEPIFSGGGQERGFRSGTLNVPGIVGLGTVAALCLQEMEAHSERLRRLTDELWQGIQTAVPDARLNGHPERRIPGTINVAFPRVNSERLMLLLKGFAFSASSACQSGKGTPSPVLAAIGLEPELASCSVRFGLGRGTTREDVLDLLAEVAKVVRRIRGPVLEISP